MEPVQCSGTCTVTLTLQWPELTQEKVDDYMLVWATFLGACVAVLCARALYSRFRIDHNPG